mmetsp:Transcript_8783/g.32388  ORF Transcript_8783/g.32388 Transcript_8783/m.32388 type:complete len:90 (+) Transcript_8783:2013-2282(+)
MGSSAGLRGYSAVLADLLSGWLQSVERAPWQLSDMLDNIILLCVIGEELLYQSHSTLLFLQGCCLPLHSTCLAPSPTSDQFENRLLDSI